MRRAATVSLPIAALAFARGGADPSWTGPLLAFVLAAAALEAVRDDRCAWPWPLLGFALLPAAQLLPVPTWIWTALSAARAEILSDLRAHWIEPAKHIALDHSAVLPTAVLLAGACGCFVLAQAGAGSRAGAATTAGIIAAAAATQAVIGIEQYFSGLTAEGGEALARGTFGSRSHFASFLLGGFGAACGCAAGALRSQMRLRREATAAAAAAASLCATGVLLSLSRAGAVLLAGEAAATAWLLLPKRRTWALGAGALALSAGLAVAPEAAARLSARFEDLAAGRDQGRFAIWTDAAPLVLESPATGVGIGSFPYAFRRSSAYLPRKSIEHAHNDYLEIAVEAGLPACLALTALLGSALRRAGRNARELTGPEQALAAGLLIGSAAIFLHALVDFPLRLPATALSAAVLLGAACGAGPTPVTRGARRWTAAIAAGFAFTALLGPRVAEPLADRYSRAETVYAADPSRAAEAYRAVLACNPFVAPAWLRLASIARAEGDGGAALNLTRIAHKVEPHTLRTLWPLAEAELFDGDREHGLDQLSEAVEAAPDLRPAAYRLAWRAGLNAERIEGRLVASDAYSAGEWLAFLARTEQWDRIPSAYERLGSGIGEQHRRFIETRLREAGRIDMPAALGLRP